jgi:uncharacterized membrane protein
VFHDRLRLAIVAAGCLASAAAYAWLPAAAPPHWPPWLGRPLTAFLLPTVALAVCATHRQLAAGDPLQANYALFRPTVELVLDAAVTFIIAVHLVLLAVVLAGPTAWLAHLPPLLVGLALIVVGNVVPRFRPNLALGIRNRWTLESDVVWARTHRLAGYLAVAGGMAVLVAAVVAPGWLAWVVVLGVAAAMAVPALASRWFAAGRSAVSEAGSRR